MSIQLIVCTPRHFFQESLCVEDVNRALSRFAECIAGIPGSPVLNVVQNSEYLSVDLFTRAEELMEALLKREFPEHTDALNPTVYLPSEHALHGPLAYSLSVRGTELSWRIGDVPSLSRAIACVASVADMQPELEREFLRDSVRLYKTALRTAVKENCPIFVSY